MLPIVLDPSGLALGLAGRGEIAARRLEQLRAGGATRLVVFAPQPEPELATAAGDRLVPRLPDAADWEALRLLWIADLDRDAATALAAEARRRGVLVNVEDVPELCDFHSPAIVRRGDLLLTVSTGGASPALSSQLRRWLEGRFPPVWSERVSRLGQARRQWRAEGLAPAEVGARSEALIEREGWLA